MKKLSILFFGTVFTIWSQTQAQNKEFVVGSLLGLNGIHIVGEIEEMYSSTDGTYWGTGGLSFGLNVKRYFSNNFFGAFEIRYIRKGSLYEYISDYSIQAYESIKLDYIEFPILAGFKINLKKKYLLAETGLAYARLFHSQMLVNDLKKWDYSYKLSQFNQNDFSWIVHVKYPIIKNKKLLIGFRFSYSLMSIHSLYKLYNMDYGIEINYLFNRNVD